MFSAAFAVGFLFVAWLSPHPAFLRVTWAVLAVQAVVGVLGFVLHVAGNLQRPLERVSDRFLFGAPVFAPLLFTDLAALGAIALWATARAARPGPDAPAAPSDREVVPACATVAPGGTAKLP